jgi:hypothetical protein
MLTEEEEMSFWADVLDYWRLDTARLRFLYNA